MTEREINKIRDASSGYKNAIAKKKSHAWIVHWAEMAKKTVLRRLSKISPLSSDRLDRAFDADDADYDANLVDVTPPKTGSEIMADALKARNEAQQNDEPVDELEDIVDERAHDADEKPPKTIEGTATQEDDDALILLKNPVFKSTKAAQQAFEDMFQKAEDATEYNHLYAAWIDDIRKSFIPEIAKAAEVDTKPLFDANKIKIKNGER